MSLAFERHHAAGCESPFLGGLCAPDCETDHQFRLRIANAPIPEFTPETGFWSDSVIEQLTSETRERHSRLATSATLLGAGISPPQGEVCIGIGEDIQAELEANTVAMLGPEGTEGNPAHRHRHLTFDEVELAMGGSMSMPDVLRKLVEQREEEQDKFLDRLADMQGVKR